MKKCRNCEKQIYKKKSPQYLIATDYGMAKVISPPKLIVCNNQYMLEIILKTHKKTKKLDRQVKKIKTQLKSLQKSVQHRTHSKKSVQNKQSQVREVYYGNFDYKDINDQKKSRQSSVNSSKIRGVGRFTRVSQGLSSSTKQIGSDHTIESKINTKNYIQNQTFSLKSIDGRKRNITFCKQINNNQRNTLKKQRKQQKIVNQNNQNYDTSNYPSNKKQKNQQQKLNTIKPHNDQEQLLYETTFNKNIQQIENVKDDKNLLMYLPSYKTLQQSSQSCLLQPDDEQQIHAQRNRLQRQFQQLVILQKTKNESEKKPIRQQIKAISIMLSNLQD